jgi:putative transcription factor
MTSKKDHNHQDWTHVVWTKKQDPKLLPKDTILSNKQKNMNVAYNTVKKINDESNEPDNIIPVMVDKSFSKLIQEKRLLNKLSQADLAKQLSIPVSIIKDYENGSGIQNGTYVSKIKKYLNIHK